MWNENPGSSGPAMSPIPGGVRGFQCAISQSFFPYEVSSVGAPDSFQSAAAVGRIGALGLSRTYVSDSFYGRRTRAHRGEERKAYVLMMVEEGLVHFWGPRTAIANAGDLVLLNADQAFESHQEIAGYSLAVSIPAPMLRLLYAEVDDWCLIPLATVEGPSVILRQCLMTYWRTHSSLTGADYSSLAMAMIHLLGACFRRSLPHIDSRCMQAHFLRVCADVDEHLSDPELSVDTVAERLGISKSYLFVVMNAANTTLGRFILERRLDRSRQLLADPATRFRTISEIAFSLGFQDLSHFSRRFTKRFGRSPRAYRVAALSEFSEHQSSAPTDH